MVFEDAVTSVHNSSTVINAVITSVEAAIPDASSVSVTLLQTGTILVFQDSPYSTSAALEDGLRAQLCLSDSCSVALEAASLTNGRRKLQMQEQAFAFAREIPAGQDLGPPTIDDVALTTSLGPGAPAAITTIELPLTLAEVSSLQEGLPDPAAITAVATVPGSVETLLGVPSNSVSISDTPKSITPPLPPTPLSPPSPAPTLSPPAPILNDDPGQNLNLNQPAQGSTLVVIIIILGGCLLLLCVPLWGCYCMCPASLPGPLARVLLSKRASPSSKYADSNLNAPRNTASELAAAQAEVNITFDAPDAASQSPLNASQRLRAVQEELQPSLDSGCVVRATSEAMDDVLLPHQTPRATCGAAPQLVSSLGILPTPEGVGASGESVSVRGEERPYAAPFSPRHAGSTPLDLSDPTPGKFVSSGGSDGATDPRKVLKTDPPQIQETVRVLFSTSSVGASSGSDVGTQLRVPSSAAERPLPRQPAALPPSELVPVSPASAPSPAASGVLPTPARPELGFNDGCTTGVLPTPAKPELDVTDGSIEVAEVMVPEGCKPGAVFRVVIKDGRELSIACPDDANPGDILEIDVPPLTPGQSSTKATNEPSLSPASPSDFVETQEVIVPVDKGPGDTLLITTSSGVEFEVDVPRGANPGSSLFIEIPKLERPTPTPEVLDGTNRVPEEDQDARATPSRQRLAAVLRV